MWSYQYYLYVFLLKLIQSHNSFLEISWEMYFIYLDAPPIIKHLSYWLGTYKECFYTVIYHSLDFWVLKIKFINSLGSPFWSVYRWHIAGHSSFFLQSYMLPKAVLWKHHPHFRIIASSHGYDLCKYHNCLKEGFASLKSDVALASLQLIKTGF